MWGRTREEDGEGREKIWRVVEAVYDVVLGGRGGGRGHIVMELWERKCV
jgi:hypothetical protein